MIAKSIVTEAITLGKTGLDRRVESLLSQLRRDALLVEQVTAELTTESSNILETIWTSEDVPPSTILQVNATIIGASADGTSYASYSRLALFHRPATGNLAVKASGGLPVLESNAAMDFAIIVDSASGTKVIVQVNDGNQGTIYWKAWIEARWRSFA